MPEIKEVPFSSLPTWYQEFVNVLRVLRESKGQRVTEMYHFLLGYLSSLRFVEIITFKQHRAFYWLVVNAREWALKEGKDHATP